MPKELNRLITTLYNTPLLATLEVVEQVTDLLKSRQNLLVEGSREAKQDSEKRVSVENGISFLTIEGPLSYRYSWIQALCGMTSYQKLKADATTAIEMGAKTIVFDIDSPGGEAYACFETASSIRKMADEAGVKLIGYVDGQACSGGYALASVCHEIIANPMAEVGSIGVVMQLRNSLPKLAKEGTEVKFVYAGKEKIPYDEKSLTLKKEFIQDLQKSVSVLYEEFTAFVATNRNIDIEAVKNTEARCFMADDAIELGLIDKKMTHDEFFEYLASDEVSDGKQMSSPAPMMFFRNRIEQEELDTSGEQLGGSDQEEGADTPEDKGEETQMSKDTSVDLSSPEVKDLVEKARIEAAREAEEKSKATVAEIQKQLEELKLAQAEKTKQELTESLKGFSFITEDSREALVTTLMGMDEGARENMIATLEAASTAIEASITTIVGVDGGSQVDVSDAGERLAARIKSKKKSAQK